MNCMVKPVEVVFRRFAKAMGRKVGRYTRLKSGKLKANIGNWSLDYNSVYGGYVIEEMYNKSGGVSQPFGSRRHSANQLIVMMRFAMDSLGAKKRRRK